MLDFLGDPIKVDNLIKLVSEQIKQQEAILVKVKNDLEVLERKINQDKVSLTVLLDYKELLDNQGFATMKQEVDSHQEELEKARADRLKQDEQELLSEQLREASSFTNFSTTSS